MVEDRGSAMILCDYACWARLTVLKCPAAVPLAKNSINGPVVRKSQFKFPFDSKKSHYEMEK